MDTQEQERPAVDPILDRLDMFEFRRILAEKNITTPDELREALDRPNLFRERKVSINLNR